MLKPHRSAALLLFCALSAGQPPNAKRIDAEVKAITKSAILIDTHNDIPSFTVDGADIGNSPKNEPTFHACKRAESVQYFSPSM